MSKRGGSASNIQLGKDNNTPSTLTMGIEWEKYALVATNNREEKKLTNAIIDAYDKQLIATKKDNVIDNLGIKELFPQDAPITPYLCQITKDDKKFLEVIFDDPHTNGGQLEFISSMDHEFKGGIKTCDAFLQDNNLNDIKRAVELFPEIVDNFKQNLEQDGIKREEFSFKFPEYTKDIFKQVVFRKNGGYSSNSGIDPIHVTHTVPFDRDKLQEFRKEYAVDYKKPQVQKEDELTPKMTIGERDKNQPNPKIPLDAFKPEEYSYIWLAYDKDMALQPMSNLAEYVVDDLKIYKEVRGKILQKEADIKDIYQQNILKEARQKLENTIICLENRIYFVSQPDIDKNFNNFIPLKGDKQNTGLYPIDEKELISEICHPKRKEQDIFKDRIFPKLKSDISDKLRLFNSVEEKFKPIIISATGQKSLLLEHRKGDLQTALTSKLSAEKVVEFLQQKDNQRINDALKKLKLLENISPPLDEKRKIFSKQNLQQLKTQKQELPQKETDTVDEVVIPKTNHLENIKATLELKIPKTYLKDQAQRQSQLIEESKHIGEKLYNIRNSRVSQEEHKVTNHHQRTKLQQSIQGINSSEKIQKKSDLDTLLQKLDDTQRKRKTQKDVKFPNNGFGR